MGEQVGEDSCMADKEDDGQEVDLPLNYRDISETEALEKDNRNLLMTIDDRFYHRAGLLLEALLNEYEEKKGRGSEFTPEVRSLRSEIEGSKKALSNILYLRLWKLIKSLAMKRLNAIIQKGGMDDKEALEYNIRLDEEEEERLTDLEREVYYDLMSVLVRYVEKVLEVSHLATASDVEKKPPGRPKLGLDVDSGTTPIDVSPTLEPAPAPTTYGDQTDVDNGVEAESGRGAGGKHEVVAEDQEIAVRGEKKDSILGGLIAQYSFRKEPVHSGYALAVWREDNLDSDLMLNDEMYVTLFKGDILHIPILEAHYIGETIEGLDILEEGDKDG